jgi:hypothetical protein
MDSLEEIPRRLQSSLVETFSVAGEVLDALSSCVRASSHSCVRQMPHANTLLHPRALKENGELVADTLCCARHIRRGGPKEVGMKHACRSCLLCTGEDSESRILPEAINFISERFPSMDPSVPHDGAELVSPKFVLQHFPVLSEVEVNDLCTGLLLTDRGAAPPSLQCDEDVEQAVLQLLVTQFFGRLVAEFGEDVLFPGTIGVLMLACRSYLQPGSVPSSMSREDADRPRWASILRKVLNAELKEVDVCRTTVWRALEGLFSTVGHESLATTLSPHIVMTAFILGLTNLMRNNQEAEVELMSIVSKASGQVDGTDYTLVNG